MSDLNTILEKYKARSGDEQNFMDKHTDNVNVTDAPGGDTAKKVIDKMKKHDRKATRQGLDPEEEEDMYESNEDLLDMIDTMIREYYEEDASAEEKELLDEMMSSAEGYKELVDLVFEAKDDDEDDDEEDDDEEDEEDDDDEDDEIIEKKPKLNGMNGKRVDEELDEVISKKKVNKFHNKLDKLVHKSFGHSPDEKKGK